MPNTIDNYHIPQRNIGHLIPMQKLNEWYKKKTELFKKNVYDLSGLDAYAQDIALKVFGDAEAFTILYSGYSARREKGWHIHIVLLGSRWIYLVLSGKNLAQAFGLRKDDAPRL